MKNPILAAWTAVTACAVVVLFLSPLVHSEDVKAACQACDSSSQAALTCFTDNGCSTTDCTDVNQCCPACSEEIQAAVDCWLDCLPACVSETLLDYATCYTLRRCSTSCEAALLAKRDEIEAQVEDVAGDATGVSNYTIDIENMDGADLSTAQVTVDFAIDEIPDGATCETYEEYAVNYVCELGSCCKKCLAQLELVMECVVNEVVSEASSGTSTDCDFTCSSRRRMLQPSMFDGRPELPQSVLGDKELPEGDAGVLAAGMLSCVEGLAQNVAINPSSALVSFVSCIESSQGTFALQFEEVSDGASVVSSQSQLLVWMMVLVPFTFQILGLRI